ncbi:MAG: Protease HtpX [Prosthecobacter sp.]|nr:Protease HtpX [Prosthecobacter sp.]
MTSERFEEHVRRLEAAEKKHPNWFVWGTGLLACLGFAYLLAVFLCSLALTFGLAGLVITHPNAATIKLALVFGLLFGGLSLAILRALCVRLRAPEGLELRRSNAPGLMSLIEQLRKRIGSTRFHKVLLTGEYNAAVVQHPRLGMFGWHKNFLIIGLPLMHSMTPAEFEAVLAHEFAHLAGGHGRFGNWLYRLRQSWERLFEQLARQQTGGVKILTVFIGWFWPRFNARAFVLSRANEYAADALAARVAGKTNMASALKRISVYSRHLDESFWHDVYMRAAREAEPPANIYSELPDHLRRGPDPEKAEKWMRQSYLMNTTTADTHPCLRERLDALGELPSEEQRGMMPKLSGETAAAYYLGAQEEVLSASLGREWAVEACERWKERHAEAEKLAAVIEAPSADSEAGKAVDQVAVLWKRADATAGLEGSAAAQPLIHEILALDPAHAGALFARGAHRVSQDESGGLEDLEKALSIDGSWEESALQLIGGYHHRHGNKEQLEVLRRRWEAYEGRMAEAQGERDLLLLTDVYEHHQLGEACIMQLRRILEAEKAVAEAWCVRKVTKHLKHVPMHLIALRIKVPWWKLRLDGANGRLVQRVLAKLEIEGSCIVFTREKELKRQADRMAQVEGSRVYLKG